MVYSDKKQLILLLINKHKIINLECNRKTQ